MVNNRADSKKTEDSTKFSSFLEIPNGVAVEVNGNMICVTGKSTELIGIESKSIKVKVEGKILKLYAESDNKRIRKQIGTTKAHIKNRFKGVINGHFYRLKICSGHFPMNVSISKNEFIVKNFVGEKVPRIMKINERVKVKIEGDYVIIEGSNKDLAGQVAASIEQLTRRPGYDARVFQDGIYIISKDGQEIK